MKTKEELEKMSSEELIGVVLKLQEDLSEEKDNSLFWANKHSEEKTRFESFRRAVKSLVTLVE